MKASLQLKLSQHLALTPQLQQSIRLLQLSTVELNQELEKFLLENPLLERDEVEGSDMQPLPEATADTTTDSRDGDRIQPLDSSPAEPASDTSSAESMEPGDSEYEYDSGDYGATGTSSYGEGDREDDDFGGAAEAISLQQHLLDQLRLMSLTQRDQQIASALIAHLDDDGYLTYDLNDIVDLLMSTDELELADEDANDLRETLEDEVGIALKLIQHLDPPGVGARSLSECLCLQLAQLPPDTPHLAEALGMASDHLDALAQRDFTKLKRALRLSDAELKGARDLIIGLDPKPGRRFMVGETRYVVPDVVVRKLRGRWRAMLNQAAVPRLRVNQHYANLVQKSRDADGRNLSGQLQEARWLIKNIQQRFDTILRVTEAIVENQRHFFDHGEVAMRPLVLREIAEQVGLHESTVSRVTTQKYMLTPRGIFELKYFFGSSVATETGGTCSATAIRALIKQLVDAEDAKKPLSDNKIADMLADQGILVARRTIAKYRESLQIQPANLRKSI